MNLAPLNGVPPGPSVLASVRWPAHAALTCAQRGTAVEVDSSTPRTRAGAVPALAAR